MRLPKRYLKAICVVVVFFGLLNFIIYFAWSGSLGGDALQGYEQYGYYYVSNGDNAIVVDQTTWQLNRASGWLLFLSGPFVFAAWCYLIFPVILSFGGISSSSSSRPVTELGSWLASTACHGRVGPSLHFRGPLLQVAIYERGLSVRAALGRPFAIASWEIDSISPERGLLGDRRIVIRHRSKEANSPLVLGCGRDQKVVDAIERMSGRALRV